MQATDPSLFSSKLHLLQAHHLVLLSERMKQVDIVFHSVSNGAMSETLIQTLKNAIHQIAGSSGIYGFHDISAAALELDTFLKNTSNPSASDLTEKLRAFKKRYAAEIEGLSLSQPDAKAARELISPEKAKRSLPIIAVIDDDPAMILAYQIILGDIAQLVIGKDTTDALSIMQKVNPAIVFLDDIMPGGQTGLSFLESIKHHSSLSKIPVVMVTASCQAKDVLRGLSAGSVDYITKPFYPDRLLEITNNLLSRQPQQILLAINNAALNRSLLDRLVQLGCEVLLISDDCRELKNNLIIVTDGILMPPDQLHLLLSLASDRSALYIGGPDETLLQTNQLLIFENAGTDVIIPAIGKLIAAHRKVRYPQGDNHE